MSTSRDLVVLVGNPRAGSRTRAVAERVAAMIADSPGVVLDLADVTAIGYTSEPVVPACPNETALDRVRGARVLVVASPSYKGTYTGLLKLFLDRLPHRGLEDVIALPIAVAGSSAHAEATAADLGRVLDELGARVPTRLALLESELEYADVAGAVESVAHAISASTA